MVPTSLPVTDGRLLRAAAESADQCLSLYPQGKIVFGVPARAICRNLGQRYGIGIPENKFDEIFRFRCLAGLAGKSRAMSGAIVRRISRLLTTRGSAFGRGAGSVFPVRCRWPMRWETRPLGARPPQHTMIDGVRVLVDTRRRFWKAWSA
jgi:hypothetical protein